MSEHWLDIRDMIYENYANDFGFNDLISIGTTAFESIDKLKAGYPNCEKCIAYQLEPLVDTHWHTKDKIFNNLSGADEVWDYDLDNINILRDHGINAKHKPFLYTESLKRVENSADPDIDVLFFGTLTKDRLEALRSISDICNLVVVRLFTGAKLDEFIARSKIVLDLHTQDGGRQKQSRIYYSLINNKCILSEKSNINYFGDLIIEAYASQMTVACSLILNNGLWRNYLNVSDRFNLLSKSIRNQL